MATKKDQNIWVIKNFTGGLSEGSKVGIPGSFRAGIGLDYRTDPDVLSVNRRLAKNSGSTVVDAIKWIVNHTTGTYFYGDTGKVYLRTTGGSWSVITTISSSHGNGMEIFDDYLFLASDSGLHKYGPLSGTPALTTDFLLSVTQQIDSNGIETNGSASTYALKAALSELAVDKYTFTATKTNCIGINYLHDTRGTGNWTVELHDASNNIIGKKNVTFVPAVTAAVTRIEFDSRKGLTAGGSYHIHIYDTDATGKIKAGTLNTLATGAITVLSFTGDEDEDQASDVAVDASGTSAGSYAYTTPVSILAAISENSTSRRNFTAERSNLTAISIMPYARGTTITWTLTVHDSNDTLVGSTTISSASLSVFGGMYKVPFTTPLRLKVGGLYHFHVTVSATTGTPTINSTSTTLDGAFYKTHYAILDTDTNYHPMLYFPAAQAMCIGNGHFVAVYDNILYREPGPNSGSEKLAIAFEEKVRSLSLVGDYLQVGAWHGSAVNKHDRSHIYFWDGSTSGINAFKDISGEVNAAVTGEDGLSYIFHGGYGQVTVYNGALTLLKTIPAVGENKYVEIWPGAVTNFRNLVHFGISDGDGTTIYRGVYSLGRKNKDYARSLNFDYPISTGITASTAQVTAMLGIGPSLYFVAWKDTTSGTVYGVDLIDTTNDQASGTYESLVFDAEQPYYEKKTNAVKIFHKTLVSGDTITVKYKVDRESSWQSLGTAAFANDGAINSKSFSFDKRFKELELQITLATSGANAPSLIAVATFFNTVADIQET